MIKEYKYKINGTLYNVTIGDIDPDTNVAQVEVNGTPYKVEIDRKKTVPVVKTPAPAKAPRTVSGEKIISKPTAAGAGETVKAPLPGVVLAVNFKVGDTVKTSDTVVSLEAMKMENAIHPTRDGKITAISVAAGDSVLEGAALFTVE